MFRNSLKKIISKFFLLPQNDTLDAHECYFKFYHKPRVFLGDI